MRSSFKVEKFLSIIIASITVCSSGLAAVPNSEELANAQWRKEVINMETPNEGCFGVTFPDTLWHAVPCRLVGSHTHPLPRVSSTDQAQTTGNGNDYALVASGLITKTIGSFPSVSGIISESSVGVPAFGDGGILGANEYTLQINTNANSTTSACAGKAGCRVWQQFVYATDYETKGSAALFMQYWLLGYGTTCPSGYLVSGTNCYKNSPYVSAPNVPITGLGSLKITGAVVPGGNDTVTFVNGTQAYSVSAADSVLQIGTVWKESEFNVVGDAGGSEAVFNTTTAIALNVAAQFGSTSAPLCASYAGTTGETNNLTLGSCAVAGGATPSIQFTESFVPSAGAYSDTPSMKVGAFSTRLNEAIGFDLGVFGSMTPATTSTGLTYRYLADLISRGVPTTAHFELGNLSADPGANWLVSITALGVTKNAANATYGYSGGIAEWSWPDSFGFANSLGGTVVPSINHN